MILKLLNKQIPHIYSFARARDRHRQQIQFDPKLKDFTNQQQIKFQTQALRKQYESKPKQTFTKILQQRQPKLGKRFHIKQSTLNKNIRNVYKQDIQRSNLTTHDYNDLDYLDASKSHLNDQTQQIQFQRKFKQQLFKAKQTKRLIEKKEKNINNYIQGKMQDTKYLEYQEAKKELKNRKINNMMSLNRNNQQLQLLIQSGFFQNATNIRNVIQELQTIQGKSSYEKLKLLENGTNKMDKQVKKDNQEVSTKNQKLLAKQAKQTKQVEQNNNLISKQLQIHTKQTNSSISQTASSLIQKLSPTLGPQQLHQPTKIAQFIQKYEQQHQKDKQSCLQDLNLLKQIKQYQQQVFLQRYNAINFRFKGKVNFSFFKENQLASYIKNQNIEPKDLLTLYQQNKHQLSKFNVPILTPPIIATLYSRTSRYRFPQTQQNNRINMLNDKKFMAIQRKVFKNIALLNQTDFCNVIWSYAHNHEQQQGILNKKLSDKIVSVIVQQLHFRIFNLKQQDLGLALRAVTKLPIAKIQHNWSQITTYLNTKLPSITNLYTIQSIFQFLMVLPSQNSTQVASIVQKNIKIFNKYKWQQVNTLLAFVHAAGLLIKYNMNISIERQNEVKSIIKNILIKAQKQIQILLQRVSINILPQILLVMRQSQASIQMKKVVNFIKKLTVDNIKMQKQKIKQYTISNLVGNFALTDLQKYLQIKKNKYALSLTNQNPFSSFLIQKLSLKQLLPLQPVPYNSSLYFIYHQLATLTHIELHNIDNNYLLKYKNQRFYSDVITHMLDKIEILDKNKNQNPYTIQTGYSGKSIVKQLLAVCNSYSLQRRTDALYQQSLQMLLSDKYYKFLCQQSPNMLIRFVGGMLALQKGTICSDSRINKFRMIVNNILNPLSKSKTLTEEQLTTIIYCNVMLNQYKQNDIIFENVQIDNIGDIPSKFVLTFSRLLSSMKNTQNKTQNKTQNTQFDKIQQKFYTHIIQQLQYNQLSIGCPLSYRQVHTKIQQMVNKKYQNTTIVRKKWAIQIPQQKKVYFIGTYDHFMVKETENKQDTEDMYDMRQTKGIKQYGYSKNNKNKQNIQLHGIWKLYQKYYQLLGWEIRPVISFLQAQ